MRPKVGWFWLQITPTVRWLLATPNFLKCGRNLQGSESALRALSVGMDVDCHRLKPPPHAKIWLIGKDPDAGRDWGQEEKGLTEDEMAGWHHWLDGRESEWTPGDSDGQGGLASYDSWGCKESDTTEWLNWTELNWTESLHPGVQTCSDQLWGHGWLLHNWVGTLTSGDQHYGLLNGPQLSRGQIIYKYVYI